MTQSPRPQYLLNDGIGFLHGCMHGQEPEYGAAVVCQGSILFSWQVS